jgi:hypothetical protein
MRRFVIGTVVVYALCALPIIADQDVVRETRWAMVDPGQSLPAELTDPEGKTRWDLSSLTLGRQWLRTFDSANAAQGGILRVDRWLDDLGASPVSTLFEDMEGGTSAQRWLLPDRAPGLHSPVDSEPFEVIKVVDGKATRLRIMTRQVGVGTAQLASGQHQVVLQRAMVHRENADGTGFEPHLLFHRWVDQREGVVAETWGTLAADGVTRAELSGAAVVAETRNGKQGLRLYAEALDRPPYVRLAFGYNRGSGTAVSSLTPDAHATIGDLIAASSWDFSGNNSSNSVWEIAASAVEVSAAETCSYDKCGFTIPGVKLSREDGNYTNPDDLYIQTTVVEREDRVDDVTIWLRAGVDLEGRSGGLFDSESRLCYTGGVTEVPLWRFTRYDSAADDYYAEVGDAWSSDPFQCENVIFNHVCPNSCGLFCPIYTQACPGYSGTQGTTILGEGEVTLPSGHTFEALLLRTVAEFCVYLGSSCGFETDQVRSVTYLWEVPNLGTVARLQSATTVADYTSYTTVEKTDIKYGLFPPLSIAASNETETSVEISWDPGSEIGHIARYRIYWDIDSGTATDYANSTEQLASAGTTATIGPLQKGTEYFFTVTAVSDYANPASQITRTYESVRFPTLVPAVPSSIPAEVSATTHCYPTDPVTGVLVGKTVPGGSEIEACWDAAADVCLRSYEILGTDNPESVASYGLLAETPAPQRCQILDPDQVFFQIRINGIGGEGPWRPLP